MKVCKITLHRSFIAIDIGTYITYDIIYIYISCMSSLLKNIMLVAMSFWTHEIQAAGSCRTYSVMALPEPHGNIFEHIWLCDVFARVYQSCLLFFCIDNTFRSYSAMTGASSELESRGFASCKDAPPGEVTSAGRETTGNTSSIIMGKRVCQLTFVVGWTVELWLQR